MSRDFLRELRGWLATGREGTLSAPDRACLPWRSDYHGLGAAIRAPADAKQLGPTFRWDGQGYFHDVRIVLPARAAADRFERFAECQRRSMRACVGHRLERI